VALSDLRVAEAQLWFALGREPEKLLVGLGADEIRLNFFGQALPVPTFFIEANETRPKNSAR
ncbi:MAG: hypothetical protein NZ937_09735, partial [Armatimonadetes bacterium]|nr:hypothetical protein [Armatimonadota bacterium]